MKTKQASEHAKTGRGPGRETGESVVAKDETRTAIQRGRDDGGTRTASKQARATETYDAIMGKNKTPLILFRPTPSPWVLIGSPASISPPPPGRGMRGRR